MLVGVRHHLAIDERGRTRSGLKPMQRPSGYVWFVLHKSQFLCGVLIQYRLANLNSRLLAGKLANSVKRFSQYFVWQKQSPAVSDHSLEDAHRFTIHLVVWFNQRYEAAGVEHGYFRSQGHIGNHLSSGKGLWGRR